MKYFSKRIIILLTLALVTFMFSSVHAANEFKIGALLGLTGPGSGGFKAHGDGLKYGVDWINDNGGLTIKGKKYSIKLIMGDTKMTPEGAVAAANKLIYNDKVKFVIGPVLPWISMATTRIFEEGKVLRLKGIGMGTPGEVGPKIPYTFSQMFKTAYTPFAFDYLQEVYPSVKRLAFISPDEPGGLYARDDAANEAKKRGIEVTLKDAYAFGTSDFYPLWSKILASKPDGLYVGPGIAAWFGSILKQGRELGFKGPIFTGQGGGNTEIALKISGKELGTDFFNMDIHLDTPLETPELKEMKRYISKKYETEVMSGHVQGWNPIWFMAQAIEAAQSLKPDEVMKSWEKMKEIKTLMGRGTIGGLETYGINRVIVRPVMLIKIQDGKVVPVKWIKPQIP